MNPTLQMKYVNVSFTGDTDDFTTTDDLLELSLQAATHIDALSHAGYEGLLYNNVPASEVTDEGAAPARDREGRADRHPRDPARRRPRRSASTASRPETVIGAEELDAALAATGLTRRARRRRARPHRADGAARARSGATTTGSTRPASG